MKKAEITFEEKERAVLSQLLVEKIQVQGVTLTIFYVFLETMACGTNLLRSLNEKYDLIRRLGLNRIW